MDTSNLSQLETSVSKILKMYKRLEKENRQLKLDKKTLMEKNQLASEKIETMITKLKGLG
jgi:uncharacterized protein (TIGR02449 family)